MPSFEWGKETVEEKGHRLWTLKGPEGAVHLAAYKTPEQFKGIDAEFYGGIEFHRLPNNKEKAAGDYHEECWLIEGPCHHEGSSMIFEELFRGVLDDEELVRSRMLKCYREVFCNGGD